jgi:hypothetical protein
MPSDINAFFILPLVSIAKAFGPSFIAATSAAFEV